MHAVQHHFYSLKTVLPWEGKDLLRGLLSPQSSCSKLGQYSAGVTGRSAKVCGYPGDNPIVFGWIGGWWDSCKYMAFEASEKAIEAELPITLLSQFISAARRFKISLIPNGVPPCCICMNRAAYWLEKFLLKSWKVDCCAIDFANKCGTALPAMVPFGLTCSLSSHWLEDRGSSILEIDMNVWRKFLRYSCLNTYR